MEGGVWFSQLDKSQRKLFIHRAWSSCPFITVGDRIWETRSFANPVWDLGHRETTSNERVEGWIFPVALPV